MILLVTARPAPVSGAPLTQPLRQARWHGASRKTPLDSAPEQAAGRSNAHAVHTGARRAEVPVDVGRAEAAAYGAGRPCAQHHCTERGNVPRSAPGAN